MVLSDMLAAEMPKRRPSFRSRLGRTSRSSRKSESSFSDREQLLTDTTEEIDEGKTFNSPPPILTSTLNHF